MRDAFEQEGLCLQLNDAVAVGDFFLILAFENGIRIESLCRVGPPAKAAVSALKEKAKDANRLIRESAQRALRETVAAASGDVGEEVGQAMAMPRTPAPDEELVRGLAAVMDRDLRRHHVGLVVQRAGLTLPPESAWLLLRLNEAPHARLADLQPLSPFTLEELERGAQGLAAKGLVLREDPGSWELTPSGCASLEKVVQARQKHLEALFAEWSPQHQSELAELLRRMGPQFVPAARQVA